MPRSLLRFSLWILTASAAVTHAGATTFWQGKFVYQSQDGYDGGGTPSTGNPIILVMTLTLGAGSCVVSQEGYQTDETDMCVAVPGADGIDIDFKSFANGSLVNQYGVAIYHPGERLFSLHTGKDGQVTTNWGSLKPDFVTAASGSYFVHAP